MSTSHLLLVSILVSLLAISASARPGRPFHPCKTLIFFSTSFSSYPVSDLKKNTFSGPRSITVFFTEIRPANPTISFDRPIIEEYQSHFDLYSSVGASFRDRTKDILRVVGSLLFGVGCGALTAATLYLFWYLFVPTRFSYQGDDSEDDFDSDADDITPKKDGYVAIPYPAPAKEVV